MPKYLCLQRSVPNPTAAEKPSAEDMQQMYEKFSAWMQKYEDNLPDPGGKLGVGKLVTQQTDGPLVEVKELVGGYMIVSADTLDEAIAVASACPGLVGPRSGVEVIEIRTQ